MKDTFYDLQANSIDGEEIDFERYRGSVVLVVNVASACGYTPQYEGLQSLYDAYHAKGFEILGFPCNQFGAQEPGDEESIKKGCMIDFGVTFPMFSKIDVNGPDAHPAYVWLRDQFPGEGEKPIEWNFTKFLIDRNGSPVKRYDPADTPESIEKTIVSLLEG